MLTWVLKVICILLPEFAAILPITKKPKDDADDNVMLMWWIIEKQDA